MDFVIQREVLLKELQRLQGVVEKKNTIPILSNTHLAGPSPLLTSRKFQKQIINRPVGSVKLTGSFCP